MSLLQTFPGHILVDTLQCLKYIELHFPRFSIHLSGRMAQLLRRETSCFEPLRSGFTRVQFPVKVKL